MIKTLFLIVVVITVLFSLSFYQLNENKINEIAKEPHYNFLSKERSNITHIKNEQKISLITYDQEMVVKLHTNLRTVNGFSNGDLGVPVTFNASVLNGSGVYTYHWYVNSIPVYNVSTFANSSILTWNFTHLSNFPAGFGYYDFINVSVNDTNNQHAFAYYYGTFTQKAQLFLNIICNKTSNYTILDIHVSSWQDISPLNITIYVNNILIYSKSTIGWGHGTQFELYYRANTTGTYNVTAIGIDSAGKTIFASKTITIQGFSVVREIHGLLNSYGFLNFNGIIFYSITFFFIFSILRKSKETGT